MATFVSSKCPSYSLCPLPGRKHRTQKSFPQKNVRCSSALEDGAIATISKILANTVCYPIESVRMWNVSNTNIKPSIKSLYAGYTFYLPYTIVNNAITFVVFFQCLEWFKQHPYGLLCASVITCVITSLYKVPVSYTLKRTVIQQEVCYKTVFHPPYFVNAYTALLLEDVPELFIKFYLRSLCSIHSIHEPVNSLLVACASTLLLAPFEMYKTSIICHNIRLKFTHVSILLKIINSIVNTFVFFTCMSLLS